MKTVSRKKGTLRSLRSSISTILVATASVALIGSFAIGSSAVASASAIPRVSGPPCTVSVSAGTGAVVGNVIAGVTAGTTKILFDCDASATAASNPAFVAETSLLAGIVTTTVSQQGEADSGAISSFTLSNTDTNCPAATAGQCTLSTFTVPATFAAADAQAACAPTQTQVNEGLWGCDIAVASSALTGISGAEYLLTFVTQATPPNAPTIAAPSSGVPGSTIKVSDASGGTGYWWANAIQQSQAIALSTTPQAPPTTCASTGGYGNVPTPFLAVNWFVAGTTVAIPGSAAGVTISNDCYDGTTLHAPVLGGTITVPSSLKLGTTYKAYLCELNLTGYPSNDPNWAGDCGPAPSGRNWIDASFNFNVALGPITQIAPTSAVVAPGTAASTQLNVSGNNGSVSFVQSSAAVPGLSISPTGLVTGASTLAVGSYTISGTDSDTSGDSGTWTFTLNVGTAQAPLSVTSVSGTLGTALNLTTSGGSGSGTVSYVVTDGTATGCAISGTTLSATSVGTCVVTATKAGDSTYVAATSAATTVTFVLGNGTLHLVTHAVAIAPNATSFVLHFSCSVAACRGTVNISGTLTGTRAYNPITVKKTIDIASAGIAAKSGGSVTVRFVLSAAARSFFATYPDRPTESVSATFKLGSSTTTLGRVSLLK